MASSVNFVFTLCPVFIDLGDGNWPLCSAFNFDVSLPLLQQIWISVSWLGWLVVWQPLNLYKDVLLLPAFLCTSAALCIPTGKQNAPLQPLQWRRLQKTAGLICFYLHSDEIIRALSGLLTDNKILFRREEGWYVMYWLGPPHTLSDTQWKNFLFCASLGHRWLY